MSRGNDEGPGGNRSLTSTIAQDINLPQRTTSVRQPVPTALGCMIPPPIGCDEAERGVLGGLLLLPALEAQAVTDSMMTGDFTDPRHRVIFEAVAALTATGTPADPITTAGHLRRIGEERCFTADRDAGVYLFDLLDALPSVGNLGHYARIVVEHSARRRAVEASVRIAQAAELGDLDTARQVTLDELLAVVDAFDRIGGAS